MVELSEIERTVRTLPPEAQKELQHFVDYLQHKYRTASPGDVVKLSGLWADVDFDVNDEDVRALRRRVTDQLLKKI